MTDWRRLEEKLDENKVATPLPAPFHPKPNETAAGEKKDRMKKGEKKARVRHRQQGLPSWLLVTVCLLALAVPIGLVLVLIYKKRAEAAAPEPVSTKEEDDEPDSPRPDPYASAFANYDDRSGGEQERH